MITTTLNRIREHSPCQEGWTKLLKHLGKTRADDEPLPYAVIARSNGIDDVLWCCRAEPDQWKTWRLFAVWCGRQVEHLMEDERSKNALNVAERHANGEATDDELAAARAAGAAAWFVARDAWAARAAAWAAGDAGDAAGDAAWAARAARAAAWAAGDAGDAAGDAAWAAARAAGAAAGDAAWAAGDAQLSKFIEMVGEE